MKNLKPIQDNSKTVFTGIISLKRADKKTGLDRKVELNFIKEVVFSRFEEYEKNKTNLENLSDSVFLYDRDRENLIHCYGSETEKSSLLLRNIKDAQENNLKGTCQYCGLSEPSSIDHYLPKDIYPEFSVYTLNLIPCCLQCNQKKGIEVKENGVRRIINLYFDDINAYQFLFCDIKMDKNIPIINFEILNNGNINNTFFQTIEYHFSILELKERYKNCSNSVINELKNSIQSLIGSMSVENIKKFILEDAKLNKKHFGLNYWRAILKESLANSDEFMKSCQNKLNN